MANTSFLGRRLVVLTYAIGLFLFGFFMATGMHNTNTLFTHVSEMCNDGCRPSSSNHDLQEILPKVKPLHEEVIDDSGALSYLQHYSKLFTKDEQSLKADPQKSETITQWWEAAAMIDWYLNGPTRFECNNNVAFSNWYVCQDEPYTVKPPCLVYSFGIAFDYSFDDALGKLGCEVHSFDPSMGKGDHKRNKNITFHNMGLGNANTNSFNPRQDIYVQKEQRWKLRTLKAIMRELGHSNRVIDVLKMDVEGHEWGVVDNFLETGILEQVRHFSLEFHLFADWPLKKDFVNCYNIYRRLRESGLKEYAKGPHPKTLREDGFNNQGDAAFVNTYFHYRPPSGN